MPTSSPIPSDRSLTVDSPGSFLHGVRSLLFVPGHEEERARAALASDADAVVVDLEDLCPDEAKAGARDGLPRLFAAPTAARRLVRINSAPVELQMSDLLAVSRLDVDGIVVPKATPHIVGSVVRLGLPVIAVIESAAGLRLGYETAATPGVEALAFGANDFGADLRLEPMDGAENLLHARSRLVVDSVAAGRRGPFDRVLPATASPARVEAEVREARAFGFGGKACVSIDHALIVNAGFARADA